MISAACKRKSIEKVDVVEEHFQLTLVLSLVEEGEKVFHLNENEEDSSISKLFYAHKPLLLKASF